jgi:hypothetical protein
MNMLWLQLRSAANGLDDSEMARLILQILNEAAESEEMFRPLRERIRQDEERLLAAAGRLDTPLMSEIVGRHCRAMFRIRHAGWPVGECDELILAMKRAAEAMDTASMVDAFERLLKTCQSEPRTPVRQAGLRDIYRARKRAAAAMGDARWREVGQAFADMLGSLAEARPDFEELPSMIAEAKAKGVFESCADYGTALAENVYSILQCLVSRYADKSDRDLFDGMMSALKRGRADMPPAELLFFLGDAMGQAVALRNGVQKLPLPMHGPRGRN